MKFRPTGKKAMAALGYEFVRSSLGLQVFPVERPAAVRPVTRIESRSDDLAVPASVALAGGDIVEHLLNWRFGPLVRTAPEIEALLAAGIMKGVVASLAELGRALAWAHLDKTRSC